MATCLALGSCSGPGPPQELIDQLPSDFDGEVYFYAEVDGSWAWDQPDPGVAKGWLVPCEHLGSRFEEATSHLAALGYQTVDGSPTVGDPASAGWVQMERPDTSDFARVRAEQDVGGGSEPNVEPYTTRGSVSGRCGVIIDIEANGR